MLETPRLRLRPLEEPDLDALLRIFADPSGVPHFPRALSPDEVRPLLARHRALHAERGLGLRAVVLRETGETIGDCGVSPLMVDGFETLELGYHLVRAQWGRGYATEAARAVLQDARSRGAGRVVSLVLPENAPSRRVAERLGARVEGTTLHAGLPHLVYAHP